MGMDANVICIGKFSHEIIDCLEYGPEFYKGVVPGTIIITHLFNCTTSDQSRWLAEALGGKAWDFNTHCIANNKVDWVRLYEMMEGCIEWDGEAEIKKFAKLLKAEFMCIYQPNG